MGEKTKKEKKQDVQPLVVKTPETLAQKEEPNSISAEQFQQILQQANVRIQQLTEGARQMEQMLRDRTVDHLFNVMKYPTFFDADFVDECAKTLEQYLRSIAFTEETKEEEKQ